MSELEIVGRLRKPYNPDAPWAMAMDREEAATLIESLSARLREAESQSEGRWVRLDAAVKRAIAAESALAAAQERIGRLEGALKPFAEWAENEVDEEGWSSPPMRERIVDWFGPSDFRAARTALEGTPS